MDCSILLGKFPAFLFRFAFHHLSNLMTQTFYLWSTNKQM
uniref:Glutaredoxin-1 grx1 n=1 Tax=Rhizophora mucronata TaxID=61149 RepID=A0A2P2JGY1_RHIMU